MDGWESARALLAKREQICRVLLAAAADNPHYAAEDFRRAGITSKSFLPPGDVEPHSSERDYAIIAAAIARASRLPTAQRWRYCHALDVMRLAGEELRRAGLYGPTPWAFDYLPDEVRATIYPQPENQPCRWNPASLAKLLCAVKYSRGVLRRGIVAMRAIDAALAVSECEEACYV